ncbi:MAG TPA: hypothetical protein VHI93_04180 [Candidatus Thermoplasmatota archaeon]|nr:hypothetical protein [Candidatus Thermoplasmatota archaeon]
MKALALLALLAWLPDAAAYSEAEAASLRPDVVRAGHSPQVVAPHTQWQGFLVLRPGHAVVAAQYQVCRVGEACFAPPAPAVRQGNDTFAFDTANYTVQGRPVDYQAGWRIGVQWILTERVGNATRQSAFPAGPGDDPACREERMALACQERHYLVFSMAPGVQPSPPPAAPLAFLFLLAAAGGARRRHG